MRLRTAIASPKLCRHWWRKIKLQRYFVSCHGWFFLDKAGYRASFASPILNFDRLPLHRDKTLGPEDDANSAFLDVWLDRYYRALGYDGGRGPGLFPQERLG